MCEGRKACVCGEGGGGRSKRCNQNEDKIRAGWEPETQMKKKRMRDCSLCGSDVRLNAAAGPVLGAGLGRHARASLASLRDDL